jgi:DNA-binding transcriptional LysR family regulator
MIDIQKIETFLCVAENLNISEAAKQIHLSQPTVSHQIKLLEQELGVSLFIRSNTGLRLTEAGRLTLPWARHLLHDINDFKGMVSSLQNEIIGELNIACSSTVGKYILPQLAVRFSQRFPNIKVRILACGPEHITLKLLDGAAHLGVISTEIEDVSFEAQEIFLDKIVLIVPANHRWAKRKTIAPEEIVEEKIIMREENSGTRRVMLTELAKYDISLDDLNILLELGNTEAIVHTVTSGYGVSFVSNLAAACPLAQGKLVEITVEGMTLQRKIYMLRKRISALNRPRDVFWGFIHEPSNADILKQLK